MGGGTVGPSGALTKVGTSINSEHTCSCQAYTGMSYTLR